MRRIILCLALLMVGCGGQPAEPPVAVAPQPEEPEFNPNDLNETCRWAAAWVSYLYGKSYSAEASLTGNPLADPDDPMAEYKVELQRFRDSLDGCVGANVRWEPQVLSITLEGVKVYESRQERINEGYPGRGRFLNLMIYFDMMELDTDITRDHAKTLRPGFGNNIAVTGTIARYELEDSPTNWRLDIYVENTKAVEPSAQ